SRARKRFAPWTASARIRLSFIVEPERLPPPRATRPAADVGFQPGAVEQHRIDREAAALDSAALGVRMLANSGFMVAEEALKRGAIQPAPGLGQQVEHPLALRVKLEGLALGATQDFAASVTGPGGVAERLLDHELFRSALDRRQPPLAVAQDESEPTGVL